MGPTKEATVSRIFKRIVLTKVHRSSITNNGGANAHSATKTRANRCNGNKEGCERGSSNMDAEQHHYVSRKEKGNAL